MRYQSLFFLLSLAAIPTCGVARAADPVSVDTSEYEKAFHLTPDIDNGRKVYKTCATCHGPEGWGRPGGEYPQISGQLRHVIIKQLIDIRKGNRGNPLMLPFTDNRTLQSAQDIVDVAEYIARLPMTNQNETGPGFDPARGEKLYKDNCVDCHGDHGQGDDKEAIPQLYGQHYDYLVRQFHWIQVGRRKNADPDMVDQIRGFRGRDISDVMDYVSRLSPPKEKLAKPGWTNPDFPHYDRGRLRYVNVEERATPEAKSFKQDDNIKVENDSTSAD